MSNPGTQASAMGVKQTDRISPTKADAGVAAMRVMVVQGRGDRPQLRRNPDFPERYQFFLPNRGARFWAARAVPAPWLEFLTCTGYPVQEGTLSWLAPSRGHLMALRP